jgi:hypothetical protein
MARQVNYLNPLLRMSSLYNPYLYNVNNSQLFRGMPTGMPSKRTPGQLGSPQSPVIPSIPRAGYVGPGRSYQAPLSPGGNIMPPTIDARPQTDLSTLASFDNTGRRSIGGKYADFVSQVGSLGNPSAKFAKTMAPFTQGGQAGAINQFVQNPKLGTAASAGLSYALNANPYYAAANTLTGGVLDKGINRLFNRRKRGQNVAQANEQANIANRMNQYGNEYMRMYGEQQASRREAEQNINEYRNQARNLSMFGPSARETAGLVASAMAPAQQAAAAAQANLAARGAEAGLSPASGVQMGGQVALQQGLAQAAGQVGTQISQDMQRRAFGMQDTLAGMDAQQRNLATQTALQSLGAASELPMALERLRMAQQQADYARDEQMYQRRFGEQQMLATGLGAFAPELFDLYKRNRGQEEADTGMIEDAGMLPESDFGQVGGRGTYRDPMGTLRFFDTGQEVLSQPNVSPAGLSTMPGGGVRPITTPDGRTVYQMPDGTVYDSSGNVSYSPQMEYESRFTRPVSQSTQIALEMMNPGAREGEYAMNKPPQLANQEFRLVNGRWMKT